MSKVGFVFISRSGEWLLERAQQGFYFEDRRVMNWAHIYTKEKVGESGTRK
jgi:hypothetical protein